MPLIPQFTDRHGCGATETTNKISGARTPGTYNVDSAESCEMAWTSQDDELASSLEDCVSAFRSGLQQLQDISFEDLVFCEPQKDTDLTIPPPLQIFANANLPFLHYHDWIIELYKEAQNLDCGRFERCERIKHSLLDDLRNEWTKLEKLKHRAWQMASLRSPEPGSAQITNTCEYSDHI